ncbi:MAG: hypothetical protein KGI29_09625 [Pseudomonadota bacterium]|nr:hypothetical protein [Pseudomonadota bacterium]
MPNFSLSAIGYFPRRCANRYFKYAIKYCVILAYYKHQPNCNIILTRFSAASWYNQAILSLIYNKGIHMDNRSSENSRDDVEGTILFANRLQQLQESLFFSSQNVSEFTAELSFAAQKKIAEQYKLLSFFTGLLMSAAEKMQAEVSETGAALRREARLDPALRVQLYAGMGRKLVKEVSENYADGDNAEFSAQITAFINAINDKYHLSPPNRNWDR